MYTDLHWCVTWCSSSTLKKKKENNIKVRWFPQAGIGTDFLLQSTSSIIKKQYESNENNVNKPISFSLSGIALVPSKISKASKSFSLEQHICSNLLIIYQTIPLCVQYQVSENNIWPQPASHFLQFQRSRVRWCQQRTRRKPKPQSSRQNQNRWDVNENIQSPGVSFHTDLRESQGCGWNTEWNIRASLNNLIVYKVWQTVCKWVDQKWREDALLTCLRLMWRLCKCRFTQSMYGNVNQKNISFRVPTLQLFV